MPLLLAKSKSFLSSSRRSSLHSFQFDNSLFCPPWRNVLRNNWLSGNRDRVMTIIWKLLYTCDQINEISFEPQMETIFMLMILAVLLCYLSSSERKGWTGLWPLRCRAVLHQFCSAWQTSGLNFQASFFRSLTLKNCSNRESFTFFRSRMDGPSPVESTKVIVMIPFRKKSVEEPNYLLYSTDVQVSRWISAKRRRIERW